MFVGLRDVRAKLERFAAGFDPALMLASDVEGVLADAAAVEKMAATVRTLAAARLTDAGAWHRAGFRSPAHHLASVTGTSVGVAVDALRSAIAIIEQPEVSAAARCGELSAAEVAAIGPAVSDDPDSAARLVETARNTSLAELREECARVSAAACPDPEARRRRVRAGRFLRKRVDADGACILTFRDAADIGAELMAVVEMRQDQVFARARAEGRRESMEAYAADALVELVCGRAGPAADGTADAADGTADAADGAANAAGAAGAAGAANGGSGAAPSSRRARPKIFVRVDLDVLLRGVTGDFGETCDLVGYGPVPVSVVTDMIASGDPILAAIATKGEAVVGVAHLSRRPGATQRSALEWLYPSCAVQGCAAVAGLEFDHREDWAATHFTLVDLMDRLCWYHHDLKTRENWALVGGTGKRALVAPHDPRHPRWEARERTTTGPPGAA